MRLIRFGFLMFVFIAPLTGRSWGQAKTPWQTQDSGATATLRGIHSVNGSVAWASGTGGTVLRTTDGGAHWQKCATPDAGSDGATLDFRGVEGWDAKTAIAMSSGSGDKSRLYKTTDGCKTWELLFANPEAPQGFFDSFWFNGTHGMLVGDPVAGKFVVYFTSNSGRTWKRDRHAGLAVQGRSLAAFAASNSCIPRGNGLFARSFAAGGKDGSVFLSRPIYPNEELHGVLAHLGRNEPPWKISPIALASGTVSSGAFSVAYRYPVTTGICERCGFGENARFVVVGGDYTKPDQTTGTAAWSADGGETWTAAEKPPHGYRSSVEWSKSLNAWIAAGANGSDISQDDGKTWQPLDDGNWNALSLPFVVGTSGRIARLTLTAPRPAGATAPASAQKSPPAR
jgi:photosystem II stability/assembly factor-like uncharacterized protein